MKSNKVAMSSLFRYEIDRFSEQSQMLKESALQRKDAHCNLR
jgi:hypothetical protein